MRREFNPTLRAASSRKAVKKTIEDTVVDLTLMEGDSTTLYYSGSPLMQPLLVSDPNGQEITVGNTEQKRLPVLAIGLATDDATTDAGDPSIRPPVGGFIRYNQDSPNRPCVFFDLSSIPSDAIIEEATLELEVVEETDPFYNVFFSLFDGPGRNPLALPENVWPDSLTLEALNLSRHATPNATWNYYDSSISNRWKSIPAEEGTFLTNPIGMMQNTRRSDYPEPVESYDEQRIDSSSESFPNEYYGHIGYGIDGGGFVENYPHTSEDLVVEDSDSTFVFDVTDQVQYGYDTNNKKCNLIVRATNPGPNLAAASPDAQVEIEPVKLDSVHISDTPTGAVLDPPEEEQGQTVHCVLEGLENATQPVTYQWWKESAALEPFGELDSTKDTATVKEGFPVSVIVTNARSVGGDLATNELQFDWITTSPGGVQTTQETSSSTPTNDIVTSSFTIPGDVGNHNLKCFITISNPELESDELDIIDFGTIGFDGVGDLTVTVTTGPDALGEVVNGNRLQVTSTVTGVVAPTFDYEFAKDSTIIDSQSDVSTLTSGLYTITLPPDVPGSGTYSIATVLKEDGIEVDRVLLTWSYNVEEVPAVSWVEVPEYRSGVYKLKDTSPPLLTQPNRWNDALEPPCVDFPDGIQYFPDFDVDLDVIEDSKCTGGSFSGKPYLNNNNPIIAFLAPNGAQNAGNDPCPQGVGPGNVPLDRYPRLLSGENIPITVFSKFGFGGEWEAGIGADGNGLKRPTDMAVWSANGGWRYYVAYSYLCKFVPITACGTGNIQALNNPSQLAPETTLDDAKYSNTSGDVNRELNTCSSSFPNDGSSTVTGWLQIAGPALPDEGTDLGETWFFHFRDGWSAGRPGDKGKFEPTDIDPSLHFTGGIPRPDQAMLNSWPNPSEFMTETGGTPSGLPEIPEANPLLWNPQSGFDLTFPSHIVHAQLGVDPQLPSNFDTDICNVDLTPLVVPESQLSKNDSLYGYMKLGDDFNREADTSNATHYGPGSVSPLICGSYMAVCVEPDQESMDNAEYFDEPGNPLPPNDRESLAFHKWVIDHPNYQYIVEVYRTNGSGVRNLHGIICSNSGKAFPADIEVKSAFLFPRSIYWEWDTNLFLPSTFYKAGDELIVYMFNNSDDLTNAIIQAKAKVTGAFSGINDNGSNLVTFNETSAIDIGIPDIPT